MIDPAKLAEMVKKALDTPPNVVDTNSFPSRLGQEKTNQWERILDVFVVAADLKNSTRMGTGKYINGTVGIYMAATDIGVTLIDDCCPSFIDIQGDGFFGIFHGDYAGQRALAAAMMLAHFSKYQLEPGIRQKLGKECPPTGLKIGVATGRVAVASIGVHDYARPVWAGKPVNWAAKCSESASAHQVIATGRVFDHLINTNDYLKQPCYHIGHPREGFLGHIDGTMWRRISVPGLPPDVKCVARDVPWCDGDSEGKESAADFCQSVLNGETDRHVSWRRRNGF